MKLCVTSTGKDLDAKIQVHFGRASYFLIINTDSMDLDAVPNTAPAPERGTGIAAAQLVLDRSVDAVLTGMIGPKAFDALRVGLVDVYEGASSAETVREAVKRFKEGAYKESVVPSGGPARST